ncbi:MAG TPA: hypothetical protein VIA98_00835 [Allosphingosinicella sp.]|jgi:hypothetical protein
MRKLIIAATLLASAVPAFAQPYPNSRDDEIVRDLPRPGEIEEVGDRVGRVADAILDVPIGPVVDAVDPYRRGRHHRDETLGDIARHDDPYARERMRDQIGAATVGLGAIMQELAVMTPVLRRSLEDATRRMEDAMAGRGRDYRHDDDRRYDDRRYEDRDDRRYDERDDDRPRDDYRR